MITIIKNKNYCHLSGDKGTLDYVRRILSELLTIKNEEYKHVEKRYYSSLWYVKKLRSNLENTTNKINYEKERRKKGQINIEQYNRLIGQLREQSKNISKEVEKKQRKL